MNRARRAAPTSERRHDVSNKYRRTSYEKDVRSYALAHKAGLTASNDKLTN